MNRYRKFFSNFGPGLAIAATGVGAGDLVTSAVAGSRYGLGLAWAIVVGAGLKFALNEGLARWQLATGTTLISGWTSHFGNWVKWSFLLYLVLWSWVVGGALASACGLAAHSLFPNFSIPVWGSIHSLVAILFVLWGRYLWFERLMKIFVALMFCSLIVSALIIVDGSQWMSVFTGVWSLPQQGWQFSLGVMGGVGGEQGHMAGFLPGQPGGINALWK